jgi:hypothetical protein
MKKVIGIVVAVTAVALCGICGEYFTRAMGTGGVNVTNVQQNASWELSAVAISFGAVLPAEGEKVSVTRVSHGMEYKLGETAETGQSMIMTVPEGLTFKAGDYLKIYGGGATGVVQVFTK